MERAVNENDCDQAELLMFFEIAVKPDEGWDAWQPEAGRIYEGLPDTVYHRTDAISKHGLDLVARAPAYYRYHRDHPMDESEASDAMVVGSAFDCLVLEPDIFDERYVVEPDGTDRRKRKEYAEWKEGVAQGRTVLRSGQWDTLRAMRDATLAFPYAGLLKGIAQPSLFWLDTQEREYSDAQPTNRLCRARMDLYSDAYSVAVDLKTTIGDGTRARNFTRSVSRYRYHVQEAFYRAGAEALGLPVEEFVFFVVEKEPPHLVNMFLLEDRWRVHGRRLWERDLQTYDECMRTDEWPGHHDDSLAPLEMPEWAEGRDNED